MPACARQNLIALTGLAALRVLDANEALFLGRRHELAVDEQRGRVVARLASHSRAEKSRVAAATD